MNVLGALLSSNSHTGRHVSGEDFMPGLGRARVMERKQAGNEITEAQQLLGEKLSQRLAEKLPTADLAKSAAPVSASEQDFSPATVADRILGFIEKRLSQEKANGASEEVLRQRLEQGVEGFLKGMQEARDELESRGIFNGTVRDNYFETFGRVQQGLDELKEGLAEPKPASTTPIAPTVSASGTRWASEAVAVSASREFAMEVTTRDGDVVKINVASARAFSSATSSLQADGINASAFSAELSGEDSFSFTVEGELDEGEMSALNALFAQVNDVATTFYGGNVEAAFEQALSVGYDQNELAGFAANMTQTQTVAATQAYGEVARAGGGEAGQGRLLAPLIDFAREVRNAERMLKSAQDSLPGGNDLFRKLLGELPTQVTPTQVTPEMGETKAAKPWQQFIDGLVPAAA